MSTPPKKPAMKSDGLGLVVNIFSMEGADGIVLVDGVISAEFGQRMSSFARNILGKPFPGKILTRRPPDHLPGIGDILGDVSLPIHALQGAVNQAMPRMRNASFSMPSSHTCPAACFSPRPYTNSPEHCRPLQLV
jgi:hypothetical protein